MPGFFYGKVVYSQKKMTQEFIRKQIENGATLIVEDPEEFHRRTRFSVIPS